MPAWERAEKEDEYFNPRPPRGGRRQLGRFSSQSILISIHAPREGGDATGCRPWSDTCISIHAPREGGDVPAWERAEKEDEYFNPRPPRGGRRSRILGDAAQPWISIHAPREGGDSLD